ncbi:anti-sigma factor family protein [Phytohabitans suffuscus]|uniref:RNA polymerase subunit sigma n=1 Tax=Phytohabitans suffuscus TaxID=624315 RepID=A0A6F8YP91_9ACTN|nr:zf-HC2 domain-containing protein [Phytohabitans suffuscus]BCB87942.1 RNA polymerase subunit sigma [Phytohabitans suffuscus]
MSRAAHWDVAAYALGVLDPQESERFEEHLAGCWACAGELESMLPVVNMLSEVDGESLITAEQSRSDGRLLDRMIVEVGAHRRKVRSRQWLAAAAAVVVLATTTGVSLVAGGHFFGSGGTSPDVVAGGPTGPVTPPLSSGEPGPGIGGPELSEDGERFAATDVQTGVEAKLVLETKTWGTQVSFQLTKLTGPRQCRLTVVREDGTKEVLNTWSVPPAGYGTKEEPQPLLLTTSTATARNEIDRIQVQQVTKEGVVESLVEVPV